MSVEKNNEITVKVNKDFDEVIKILINSEFKITDEFSCEDTYFVPKEIDINKMPIRDIIKNAVIIRSVRKDKVLVFKKKEIDKDGNIISQEKIECDILNIEDAKKFIKAIGYKEIMEIAEDDVCYSKNGLVLILKNIRNGDNLIEVETKEKEGLKTIEDLKKKILELNLPIDTSNFFVKKAEIELEKAIKRLK